MPENTIHETTRNNRKRHQTTRNDEAILQVSRLNAGPVPYWHINGESGISLCHNVSKHTSRPSCFLASPLRWRAVSRVSCA